MNIRAQTIEFDGKRITMLPESEYLNLLDRAGLATPELGLPPLPKKMPGGGYPALEYARASIAREIVRTRRRLGLSQAELARRAGMLPSALNRIERARIDPGISTVEKIDQALRAAEKQAQRACGAAG